MEQEVEEKAIKLEDGVLYAEKLGEGIKFENYDTIILAVGSKTVDTFGDKENLAAEVYTIGDAKNPRSAVEAIFEGARVAIKI